VCGDPAALRNAASPAAAVEHPLVNRVAAADPAEVGGKARWVLADELHLTRGEAGRRISR